MILGCGAVGNHLKKQQLEKERAEAERQASEQQQYVAQSVDAEKGYPPPSDNYTVPPAPAPAAPFSPAASTVAKEV